MTVSSSTTFIKDPNATTGYGVLCGNDACDIKRLFVLPTQNSILWSFLVIALIPCTLIVIKYIPFERVKVVPSIILVPIARSGLLTEILSILYFINLPLY